MTYQSLVIEEYPDAASAKATYVLGASNPPFGSLNAYTWPLSARTFAAAHGLTVDYVDNCWVRVAMPAPLFRIFLEEGGAGDPHAPSLTSRIVDGRWFVINEEEY
jgi:hypothetical protein